MSAILKQLRDMKEIILTEEGLKSFLESGRNSYGSMVSTFLWAESYRKIRLAAFLMDWKVSEFIAGAACDWAEKVIAERVVKTPEPQPPEPKASKPRHSAKRKVKNATRASQT